MIDETIIIRNTRKHNSDRYIKRVTSKDHLISMLFCVSAKCYSLREVSGAILGLSDKTKYFKLENLSYRSTLSDANMRRSSDFFCDIYNDLLKKINIPYLGQPD